MEKLLEINALKSWYGLSQALFDVNLEINQGEVVALLGRNGMGKSTTISSICGLISSYEGEIKFKNISMLAKTHGQPASPTKLGKEFKVFSTRIREQIKLLKNIPHSAKFGGATGNFNAHHVAFPKIQWKKFFFLE